MEFSAKNDKISKKMDQLNLSNEQKSDILKVERDFDRELDKLTVNSISSSDFIEKYDELKEVRNSSILDILTEEQKKALD